MRRLAETVLRHRLLVVVARVVIAVAGAMVSELEAPDSVARILRVEPSAPTRSPNPPSPSATDLTKHERKAPHALRS